MGFTRYAILIALEGSSILVFIIVSDASITNVISVLVTLFSGIQEESPSKHCDSSGPRGVICPQSLAEIPVFLLAKATGTLHHSLRIAVFGSVQPPLVSGSLCVRVCVCVF